MKIIFFGTPEFAATVLKKVVQANIKVAAVVTRADKPQGRSSKLVPPPVKVVASELLPDVPLHQPIKCSTQEMITSLKAYNADLFVVVAYGEILTHELLDIPKLGCINIHGSLLPKLRGAAPIQRALMQGEKETGITIIRMVRKMDAGQMLCKRAIPIGPDTTYGEIERELAELGAESLVQLLQDIEIGAVKGEAQGVEQDESQVTFADKITPQDCEIKWDRPVRTIHNQVRALSPEPGAYTFVQIRGQKKRLKVLKTQVIEAAHPQSFDVPCVDGTLRLLTVQLEGKPTMPASEFLKGTPRSEIELCK